LAQREFYTFLRQADAKELNDLFRALKKAQEAGDTAKAAESFDHFLSK
jgi:isocitrate lyase